MEKTERIVNNDEENMITDRVLWYMKKFGIDIRYTYDIREIDTDYYEPRFSLNEKPLTIDRVLLPDKALYIKADCVNSSNSDGIEIRSDRIKFCRSNPKVKFSTWSWEIYEKKLENGISLVFSSLSSGLKSQVTIQYDDNGNITIQFACGDYVINEGIPFGSPHDTADVIANYLVDNFSDEEYLRRFIRKIPESDSVYQDIELNLIKAMLDDPILESTLDKMFDEMPEIVFQKRKAELDEKYNGIICKSPEDMAALSLIYNKELHDMGAIFKYAAVRYRRKLRGACTPRMSKSIYSDKKKSQISCKK